MPQSTIPSPRTVVTPTIGLSSVLAVGTNVTRSSLVVFNPNPVGILGISPSDTTPAINGIGTMTLLPGQGLELDGWTNGLNAIASLANQQITVYEFYQ